MTQQDFARRIGVSQNYLSTIEHGEVEIGAVIFVEDLSRVWEIARLVAHR
jgi:transcriptional regulator with XRE-family HTH domain